MRSRRSQLRDLVPPSLSMASVLAFASPGGAKEESGIVRVEKIWVLIIGIRSTDKPSSFGIAEGRLIYRLRGFIL